MKSRGGLTEIELGDTTTSDADADIPLARVDFAGGADRSAAILLCPAPLSPAVLDAAMALPRDARPSVGSWMALLLRLESAHRDASLLPAN